MSDWALPAFTDGQIEKYMMQGIHYGHCPNCDSDDVVDTGVRLDAPRVEIIMQCVKCERRWKEIYRIVTIVPIAKSRSARTI